MDEPLSNLDARLRGEMRRELVSLQRRLELTMICVTHDPRLEAFADRIIHIEDGRILAPGGD